MNSLMRSRAEASGNGFTELEQPQWAELTTLIKTRKDTDDVRYHHRVNKSTRFLQ